MESAGISSNKGSVLGSIRQSSQRPQSVNQRSSRSHYSLKGSVKSKEPEEDNSSSNSFQSDQDASQAIREAEQQERQESSNEDESNNSQEAWCSWTYEECTLMLKRFPKMP